MDDVLERLKSSLLDRYAIDREIGRGGMAIVFLAKDLKHHRLVAVKVLRPELAAAVGRDRFLREIETAAQLSHPHIVPVHDSGEADGLLFYVMPYVEGESLRDLLAREKQISLETALRITLDVAAALSHAHSHGVVHRDIKPGNILFSGGEAVVADFGIARAIDTRDGLTDPGVAIGTAEYMSPEQASGDRAIDGRSDLYALGCVLYEMLAGDPPFTGSTAQVILARKTAETAPNLRIVRESVPPAMEEVIMRTLSRVPADRFQTAEKFAEALKQAETLEYQHKLLARRPRRRGALVGAGIVAAIVVSAILFAWLQPSATVIASAFRIAVVPLAPASADTALSRLGRDLVTTLSFNLDGVGEIRTVDAHAILAHVSKESASYALDAASALARRFGATSLLHGSLVRVANGVRADVRLYTAANLSVVARASAMASLDDPASLTDSLTWLLLQQVWTSRTPPSPRLAAVTTRSLPAFRAFLDGEQAVVDGQWSAAQDAFRRAFQADSTFWLAAARYDWVAAAWTGIGADTSVRSAYMAHRASLPERDRRAAEIRWIPGRVNGSFVRALTEWQQLARSFPDDWPIWFQYADELSHDAMLVGFPRQRARAALEHTVTINPNLVEAWDHMFVMSVGRDTAMARRALEELTRTHHGGLDWDHPLLWYRLLKRAQETGGASDATLADSVAMQLAGSSDPNPHEVFVVTLCIAGFPKVLIDVSERVLRRGIGSEAASWHRLGITVGWATRGAWDSALVASARYADLAQADTALLVPYRLATAGAWLGAVNPELATARRQAITPAVMMTASDEARAELAWLDGLVAVTRADRRALREALDTLGASRASTAKLLERSLQAFQLEMTGERRRAASTLATLEWERADCYGCTGVSPEEKPDYHAHPFLLPVNRLAAVRWLLQAGDTARAVELSTWHEAWMGFATARPAQRASGIVAPFAILEQARIAHARRQFDVARTHYEQFLQRYDLPMEAHTPLIVEAKDALRDLADVEPATNARN